MDSHRRRKLSGVMVALMIERPGTVGASVLLLGMTEVTALEACGAHSECARSVWDPIQVVTWTGHPALDVRISCDVCLVLGSDIRHHCIKG